ncbi:MAG: hypothetical protein EON60_02545 [Alphaproteobacteria bacterium]|nr:MAG: hypothetical protein EON60_02545 [Alphaproteobacteria bacterium]
MLMNRRTLLSRTLTAGVALAVAPALAAAMPGQPQPDAPVRWVGEGAQPLLDVLNGNVPAASVHQIRLHRHDYAAVLANMRAYRDNGMPEEFDRRLHLLKQVAVDWLPTHGTGRGWTRASAAELASLPCNRARFAMSFDGNPAPATA